MVEEQLGEGAQVLPVLLLLPPVHLEHGQVAVPVDLHPTHRKEGQEGGARWTDRERRRFYQG